MEESRYRMINKDYIQSLFLTCSQSGNISSALQYAHQQGNKITRTQLITILSNTTFRENTVPGSTFDLVQQIIKMERFLEQALKNEKKQGNNWKDASFKLHIEPGPEYKRLKNFFEKCL
ncbi:MAG TPA: hypothetical protein PKM32_08280 [Planctomycetota bacterium]|nr:hypothetical protein [Planctomycetota bacterium]HPY75279.1 hypothetical protein [Planctomycetota bacterium]HQB00946.1 hypothetical protein [Planctomycetota bacterium]